MVFTEEHEMFRGDGARLRRRGDRALTPRSGRRRASSRPTSSSRRWASSGCSASPTTPSTAAAARDVLYSAILGEELGPHAVPRRRDGHLRADRHGHPVAAPLRQPRAEGAVPPPRRSPASTWPPSRSPSPTPGPTSPACAPAPSATATSGSSTARSSTSPAAPRPTGCACWRAPPTRAARGGCRQIVVPTDVAGLLGQPQARQARHALVGHRRAGASTTCGCRYANTIGDEGRGFQQQMQQFQDERMIAAYQMVGAMEGALERTKRLPRRAQGVRQAAAREPAPRPTSWPTSPARSRCSSTSTTPRPRPPSPGEDITRFATIAKLRSGRLARKVADICLQFHGGIGYMEETWTARFFRDTRLWSIGGGADEVMLRTLARLDGYLAD